MNIRQFADRVQEKHPPIQWIDWHGAFKDQGYHDVVLSELTQWQEIHRWCEQQFGQDHYVWVANRFWFEREQDAILFALRWL